MNCNVYTLLIQIKYKLRKDFKKCQPFLFFFFFIIVTFLCEFIPFKILLNLPFFTLKKTFE